MFDYHGAVGENKFASVIGSSKWACGAAGSALPWHGRGRRFDPDQVHHQINNFSEPTFQALVANWPEIAQTSAAVASSSVRSVDRFDRCLHAFRNLLHVNIGRGC